jgi:hypothetical protein
MSISSLIRHIMGFGTAGSVNIGANTPAPYGSATVEGFVDGTGPQNASKNMAEFYNRHGFAYQHLIEAAGLTFDRENWAQMTEAVQALALGSLGACNNTGPVAGDSKYSIYKSPFGEYWGWVVDAWMVVGGRYKTSSSYPNNAATGVVVFGSITCHRAGTIIATCYGYAPSLGNVDSAFNCRILKNGSPVGEGSRPMTPRLNANLISNAATSIPVVAGSVISFGYFSDFMGTVQGLNASIVFTE